MEMTGSQVLQHRPEEVWRALFDPEVLAKAIPGCEALQQTADDSFSATVRLKVGPVSARFKGDVEISEKRAPLSCLLAGKGSGGVAGFAKGSAAVTLAPHEGGTLLTYSADAALGGKLAALGSRLIQSTAAKLADEFFVRFAEVLNNTTTTTH